MRPRPPLHCLVGKPGPHGVPETILVVTVEEAAAKFLEGWWVVGPDPLEEEDFERWIQDVKWSSQEDPGDEDR